MDLIQIVEAMIFASPEPVTAKDVARALRKSAKRQLSREEETEDVEEQGEGEKENPDPPAKKKAGAKKKKTKSDDVTPEELEKISAKQVSEAIDEINETYNATGRPMHLVEGPGGWRFYTRMEYAPYIRGLVPDVKPERFSGPAMETLAIIAYRQPITKADIEAVRGVSVDGVLNKIIDRGLVKIGGRADLPGRPLLYETTETFLEHFGIKNIDDLPNSGELRRVELPSARESEEEGSDAESEEKQMALGENAESAEGGDEEDQTGASEPSVQAEEAAEAVESVDEAPEEDEPVKQEAE